MERKLKLYSCIQVHWTGEVARAGCSSYQSTGAVHCWGISAQFPWKPHAAYWGWYIVGLSIYEFLLSLKRSLKLVLSWLNVLPEAAPREHSVDLMQCACFSTSFVFWFNILSPGFLFSMDFVVCLSSAAQRSYRRRHSGSVHVNSS